DRHGGDAGAGGRHWLRLRSAPHGAERRRQRRARRCEGAGGELQLQRQPDRHRDPERHPRRHGQQLGRLRVRV
ncbi:MAG: hypothetical protein AVDCRST_MAG77-1680, partial [uncultured Chloroflexi bacterium]